MPAKSRPPMNKNYTPLFEPWSIGSTTYFRANLFSTVITNHWSLLILKNFMNRMHARCILFIQKFTFVFWHQAGEQNKVTDALSCKAFLLTIVQPIIMSFETLKDQYFDDLDFSLLWFECTTHEPAGNFFIHDMFLFKGISYAFRKHSSATIWF